MKIKSAVLRFSDFFIINLPVFSFLLLVPAGGLVFLNMESPVRFGGPILAVWGVSGALLILKDYYDRKKNIYHRLIKLMETRETLPLDEYLRSTFCGLCIVWALRVRMKNMRKEKCNERKI